MKTAKNKEINREIAFLAALTDADIDTSDTPEVTDWSSAKRGVFYHRKSLTILEPRFEESAEKISNTTLHTSPEILRHNFRGVFGARSPASMEVEAQEFLAAGATLHNEDEAFVDRIDKYLEVVAGGPTLERDRKIFWHYYRDGMTASAIASLPTIGMTAEDVESTVRRLTKLVQDFVPEK